MPSSPDDVVLSLLQTRNVLLARLGEVWAEFLAAQADIGQVDAMLARHGFAVPSVEPEHEAVPPPPDEQIDTTVATMIADSGLAVAAQQFCEWVLRNGLVQSPGTVRALLESFTPSLRNEYSKSTTSAVETLRSQIKTWVARGTTALTYENGRVGIKPEPVPDAEQAKETA